MKIPGAKSVKCSNSTPRADRLQAPRYKNLVDLAPGDLFTPEGSLKRKTRCVVGNFLECGSL